VEVRRALSALQFRPVAEMHRQWIAVSGLSERQTPLRHFAFREPPLSGPSCHSSFMIVQKMNGRCQENALGKMKKLIKRGLRFGGYRVVSLDGRYRFVRIGRRDTRGIHIEILGPSGAGKSTLLSAALGRLEGDYMLRDEIPSPLFLKKRTPPDYDARISRLFFSGVKRLDPLAGSLPEMIGRFTYHSQVILRDMAVCSGSLSRGVMLDEGICHCFREQIAAMPDAEFAAFIEGRALVILTARDPATIVERVEQRAGDDGEIRAHHVGKSHDDLVTGATSSILKTETIAGRAMAHNADVIELVIENGLAHNVAALVAFEQRLLARRETTPTVVELTTLGGQA
jgi:hypothetical protein